MQPQRFTNEESKCYISMGSLKRINSGVTVAPKAVLLHTLLVHLLRHLIFVFGHWEKGKTFCYWYVILGNGKESECGTWVTSLQPMESPWGV